MVGGLTGKTAGWNWEKCTKTASRAKIFSCKIIPGICKKALPISGISFIIALVVTLIAMKREVAARERGFSVERMSS